MLFKGDRPANAASSSNDDESDSEDEEEDNFIVEDDEQDVVAELPERFSMSTHQDLVHHFKTIDIFQFFVHIAVQPHFYRSDSMKGRLQEEPYFSQALFDSAHEVSSQGCEISMSLRRRVQSGIKGVDQRRSVDWVAV